MVFFNSRDSLYMTKLGHSGKELLKPLGPICLYESSIESSHSKGGKLCFCAVACSQMVHKRESPPLPGVPRCFSLDPKFPVLGKNRLKWMAKSCADGKISNVEIFAHLSAVPCRRLVSKQSKNFATCVAFGLG